MLSIDRSSSGRLVVEMTEDEDVEAFFAMLNAEAGAHAEFQPIGNNERLFVISSRDGSRFLVKRGAGFLVLDKLGSIQRGDLLVAFTETEAVKNVVLAQGHGLSILPAFDFIEKRKDFLSNLVAVHHVMNGDLVHASTTKH